MKRLLFVVVAALILAVAGCSNSPSAGGTPSPAQPTSSAPASDPAPAATPSSATRNVNCLDGRYHLVRFVGVGEKRTYGTGEGGDVTVTFNEGSYLLGGAGRDPIKLTLASQNADLLVDGTISGRYRLEGNRANLTVEESTGSATLGIGSTKQSVSMPEIGSVLPPRRRGGIGLRGRCADRYSPGSTPGAWQSLTFRAVCVSGSGSD
jgi:hypothetical protein